MVASILAVMRAGASYVILDPNGPAERHRLVARDANAAIVLTERATSSKFETSIAIEDILSKVSAGLVSPKAFSPTQLGLTTEDPAYLIYTSGTTGKPKGVVLSHRAVTHGITNTRLNGHRRWLLFYNPTFSAAQRTILATLCHGATLCLAPRDVLATNLREVIKSLNVDALGITPSALSTLDHQQIPSCLKQITTVGEKLSASLADTWKDLVKLNVSFGCSECAQLSLSRQVRVASDVSIVGSPNDTTTAYILRPDTFEEAAVDETGELCLVGPQLASSYWKMPELTSKVFVSSPFGRMYRSGDLAKKHADGSIEIRGRIDNQLKIAGQRMEPDEVAAVLAAQPGVVAVHVLGATVKDQLALVAVIVPENDDSDETWSNLIHDLRDAARERLPTYMIPNYWFKSEKLPLTANLKVDTRKLRTIIEATDAQAMLAPKRSSGDLVEELDSDHKVFRDVWAAELAFEATIIQSNDSFVELGGSSIQAIKVVRTLREQGFAVELGDLVQPISLKDVPFERVDTKPIRPTRRLELVKDASVRDLLTSDPNAADAFPVSALQESLLASSLAGETMYLYQRAYDVRHLDLRRLKLSFRALFFMNDTMRSTFHMAGSKFYQVVRNDFKFPWTESYDDITKFKADDKLLGMPLGQPFIRFALLSRQVLVVTMHHALFDFWSRSFLYEDAARLYQDQDAIVRPKWSSYIRYLQERDETSLETFWVDYMSGSQPVLLNHAPVPSSHEAVRKVPFDGPATSAALGATLGSIIYSAWALVLSQHTRSNDVVFATAISGRDAPVHDADLLDGPTLATVPQRIQFDSTMKLSDLVQRTSAGLWQLNKHAQYGMRKALQASGIGSEKLLDTFVNILVSGSENSASDMFHPYDAQPMWETGFTTLQVEERDGQLVLKLLANMEAQRVHFILDQMVAAIETIVAAPDTVIKSIDLVKESEREALMSLAQPAQARPRLLQAAFEDFARNDPERTALQWQEISYTYGQLNETAGRVASYLHSKGIRKGDLVPLLLEKSPLMIISILAVLKLGGAYVPLSPENPVERNLYIAKQIDAKFVITEEASKDYFVDFPTLLIDQADTSSFCPHFAAGKIDTTTIAYIIFTSGSTGMPKGVQVSHHAVSAFADSMNDFLARKNDVSKFRTLQFSNYIFDVSVYDIFTTLSSGATLCMAPQERLLSELAEVITEMEINHCFLTPTVIKLLRPADVPTLKTVSVGGEPMSKEIVATWADKVRLINGYGPTEASVIVSSYDIQPTSMTRDIGQPLGKMSAAILDPDTDKLLPYGAVGEVCFIGPQLANGYHKDAEKTDKVFYRPEQIDLPRFYRSGDLARWLPNGELECLGRKDYQVKVNGFRIELGEIEANLLRTGAAVDAAVVVADIKGKAQLVAFVVFDPADTEGVLPLEALDEPIDAMKAGLSTLTPYMIPRIVLPLAKFPKMPSGKIDRKNLKKIADSLSAEQQREYAYAAIGTTVEEEVIPLASARQRTLADTWTEVLGLDVELGQNSDFFKLGGDSIAAISLTSLLRDHGFGIKVGDMMSASTLAAMAEVMKEETVSAADLAVFEPSQAVTNAFSGCDYSSIYACPPGQAEFLEGGSKPESFWTLMATRKLAPGTIISDWLKLVQGLTEANEILRTTFSKIDGDWYGAVLRSSVPVSEIYEVADAQERKQTIDSVWNTRFETGKPYIRYAIMRFPDGSLEVCTKLDHGLYDGTLLRIFADQIFALANDKPLPKSTPFDDFATHEWRADKDTALSYWMENARRPTDFKFPASPTIKGQLPCISSSVVHMSPAPLDGLAKKYALSASVIYQAAFTLWLSRRSGSQDISYDYLYTGRNVAIRDPQSINGTCANFLPLRMQLPKSSSVKSFIDSVQADFWSATEQGCVGLEDIYAAASTTRVESGNNALFLFQPFEPPAVKKTDGAPASDQKWIVMALSEVKMPQPYALVCEVIRTKTEEHKLKLGYDPRVWSEDEAKTAAQEIEVLVGEMKDGFEGPLEKLMS